MKRKVIANQLRQYDILFLQETHSTETESKSWHNDFKAKKGYWDHGEKNARGAAILIRKDLDIEEIWVNEKSYKGRIKAIVIRWKNQKLGLVSVYAPNISWGKRSETEYIKFMEELDKVLSLTSSKSDQTVVGGDFNIVLSKWDIQGGKGSMHTDCIEALQSCMGKHNLIDIYRENNKKQTLTTYTQFGIKKEEKRRRLDYIYVSEKMREATEMILNTTITNTDHNLIMIEIKYRDVRKTNKGIWRHNNLLNTDEVFLEGLKEMIRNIKYENPQEKRANWEFTKYKIGQYSREYSKKKAKERKEKNEKLVKDLEEATDKYGSRKKEVTEEKFRELKRGVQRKMEEEEKALIFRANTQFYEEGEKCTAFFFRQIKANRKASNINSLKREDGTVLKGKEVDKEIYNYYETLYKNEDSKEEDYRRAKLKFLNENLEKKIDKNLSKGLDKELTKEELRKALFGSMKEGKAPGNDGLTSGLYRAIWPTIDRLLFESTKEAMEKGMLTPSQRQSIIRLIEKKGKDRELIKNWRPISLMNVDTKIISKAITNRLKTVVQELIGKEQTGFLKNRYIGEGIRLTEYLIEKYKRTNKEGYVIAIDFQKAFDSCSHRYLKDVLREYGFGSNFINMIEVLYKGSESAVLNEGTSTKYFKIDRSCRQGDPISPYLFIIMLEPLLDRIRKDKQLKGLKTSKREVKAAAFADDLTAFLKNKESVERLLEILEEFRTMSGLKVNRDKTELLAIKNDEDDKWTKKLGIKKVNIINITGVYQGTDRETLEALNWDRIVERTKAMLRKWKGRDLSLMGRILIVKAQGISQIQYLASNIIMPQTYIKKINKLIYNFVWKGPDKIKRTIARRKVMEGGLAMPDAADIAKAASIQWIGRGERWADKYWNDFWQEDLEKLGGKSILNSKAYKGIGGTGKCYSFSEYMLRNWWEQVRPPEEEHPDLLLGVNIWTDVRLARPKHDDLKKLFIRKGLCTVNDFLDAKGNIRRSPEGGKNGDIKINSLHWIRATSRIPKDWIKEIRRWIKETERAGEIRRENANRIIIRTKKGSLEATKMTQRAIKQNIVDQLAREETKYRDRLAIEYGTVATEWEEIDRRTLGHSISSRSRSFMYRFSNGLTYNNKDFKRFGYKESDECSFCKEGAQTNKHLFWECQETRKLWEELNKKLEEKTIGEREVFLGDNEEEDRGRKAARNSIIAFTLQYIYKNNYKKEKITIEGLKESIKYIKKIEKEIADRKKNVITHLIKWENIEELFKEKFITISERNPDPNDQGETRNDDKDSAKTRRKERKRAREDETEQKEEEATRKRRRREQKKNKEEEP